MLATKGYDSKKLHFNRSFFASFEVKTLSDSFHVYYLTKILCLKITYTVSTWMDQ